MGLLIVFAQPERKYLLIEFAEESWFLDEDDKLLIDIAYDELYRGEILVINFLSEDEQKEDFKYRTRITAKRAEQVSKYLLYKKLKTKNIFVEITPVHKGNKKISLSNVAYRKFVRCGGTYAMIVRKPLTESVIRAGCSCIAFSGEDACVHTIDPTEDQYIACPKGTIMMVPAFTFIRKDGNAIGCNRVTITVKEFYSTEDILMAGLTTHSGRKMLETGGMLHITAECNVEELKIGGVNKIKIYIPSSECKPDMKVFEGKRDEKSVNWIESSNGAVTCEDFVPLVSDSNTLVMEQDWEGGESGGGNGGRMETENPYFLLEISKLGWINCDRFYDVKKKTELIVKTDTSLHPTVVLVFNEIRSVLGGHYFSPDGKVRFYDIPDGKEVTLLAYSINKDKTSVTYGFQSLTLGESKFETIEMTLSGMDGFKSLIGSLEK